MPGNGSIRTTTATESRTRSFRKDARVVILNTDHVQALDLSEKLAAAGKAWFDLCMLEGAGGVSRLAREVSIRRILFGSNYPLYYFESALLKVREGGFIESGNDAIFRGNVLKLVAS